ncbi:MAG: SprB repeat-containing protein, partial [Salinibacterium amurskyense]
MDSTTIDNAPACCPLTSGGTINGSSTTCGQACGLTIGSTTLPAGGSGTIEYVWMQNSQPNYPNYGNNGWTMVPGSTSTPTLTLGCITSTTYYIRCARRAGCTTYNGESNMISVIINASGGLTASFTKTDGECNNNNLGSATVSITGGASPYTYLWSNGATTATITNLTPGTYSVTATDANGCTVLDSTTIDNAPTCCQITNPGAIGYDQQNCGPFDPEGFISLLPATGGIGPVQYVWIKKPASTGTWQMIPGATGETYDSGYITETTQFRRCSRNVGCPSYSAESNILTITIYPQPLVVITKTDVNCFGGSNGTATASASVGTAPYTYLWSNGQTTATATGLLAGTHYLTVTDANGCTVNDSIIIGQPSSTLSILVTKTDATCGGEGLDGTANASVSGGTSPYSYAWNNSQTTATATGLVEGTYIVTVTDANGCIIADSIVVGRPPCCMPTNPGAIGYDQQGCAPFDPETFISLAPASGGIGPVEYVWIKKPASTGTWQMIPGATGETYDSGIITETTQFRRCSRNLGCPTYYAESNILTVTIFPDPVILMSKTDVNCYGGSDGTATATVTIGAAPFTYLWSDGQTTATATGLIAGTYYVSIVDANGCSNNDSISIGEPSLALSLIVTKTDATCGGEGLDGTASASASGGTVSYSYAWSNGQTTATATGLVEGTYIVTVTDANGCVIVDSTVVGRPPCCMPTTPGVIGYDQQGCAPFDPETFISIAPASGGIGPVEYVWIKKPASGVWAAIPGATGETYDSGILTETTQFRRCSRNVGCPTYNVESNILTVTIFPDPVIVMSKTDVNCYGGSDGTATATVTIGAAPFTYLWSDGQTTATATGLIAGTYYVSIVDANGCSNNDSIVIGQPNSSLDIQSTTTPVVCYGQANGFATTSVSGGTPSYTYLWSNGGTSASITGLVAGTYSVIATDANNCTIYDTVTVSQPTPLVIASTTTPVVCYGQANGFATTSVSGGTPSYTYLWSNGGTSASIT